MAQLVEVGSVETVSGRAEAQRADGSRAVLGQGDAVYQGDVLQTYGNSSLVILLADSTLFSLGENGMFTLDEMVYDASSGSGQATLGVLNGAFSFLSGHLSKSQAQGMVIRTPVMQIGIRGTNGKGTAAPAGSPNIIINQNDPRFNRPGTIQASNNTGSLRNLRNNNDAVFGTDPNKPLSPVFSAEPNQNGNIVLPDGSNPDGVNLNNVVDNVNQGSGSNDLGEKYNEARDREGFTPPSAPPPVPPVGGSPLLDNLLNNGATVRTDVGVDGSMEVWLTPPDGGQPILLGSRGANDNSWNVSAPAEYNLTPAGLDEIVGYTRGRPFARNITPPPAAPPTNINQGATPTPPQTTTSPANNIVRYKLVSGATSGTITHVRDLPGSTFTPYESTMESLKVAGLNSLPLCTGGCTSQEIAQVYTIDSQGVLSLHRTDNTAISCPSFASLILHCSDTGSSLYIANCPGSQDISTTGSGSVSGTFTVNGSSYAVTGNLSSSKGVCLTQFEPR